MATREILFLVVVSVCLLISVAQFIYPDWGISRSRRWGRLTGFDDVMPEFFSRTWIRFGSALGVLISLIALVAVLTN